MSSIFDSSEKIIFFHSRTVQFLQATLPINLLSLSRHLTVSIETVVGILHAVLICRAVNLGFRFEVIISFETLRFGSLRGRPLFGRFLTP